MLDEATALLGGVSGNAGLFGNTNDLAKLFQMYLQKGYYEGKLFDLNIRTAMHQSIYDCLKTDLK